MPTTPIIVPLTNGLTEDISDLDARRPGIAYCENIDFTKTGEVQGRPGFTSKNGFETRLSDTTGGVPTDLGTIEITSVNNYISSVFRYRDSNGERPGITATGRMWTYESDRWVDRLYCGVTRVERLVDFFKYPLGVASNQPSVGYNFAPSDAAFSGTSSGGTALLSEDNPSIEAFVPSTGGQLYGGACSAFSGGIAYHCVVGNNKADNNLRMVVRTGNGFVLSSYVLQTDCRIPFVTGNEICCCSDPASGTTIWVVYLTTAGGGITQAKLLKVNASTGAVITSQTYAIASCAGIWISVDSAADTLALAFTKFAVVGCFLRQFVASTLVNNAAADVTFDGAAPTNAQGPVVVGTINGTSAYFAYLHDSGTGNLLIGKYTYAGAVATKIKTYYGQGTAPAPGWAILHQPIKLQGPLAVASTPAQTRFALGVTYFGHGNSGTWFSLDITDMLIETGEARTGGTKQPGLLAMGPVEVAVGVVSNRPSAAMLGINSAGFDPSRYRVFSDEFRSFSANGGSDIASGLNEITLIYPRAAGIGEETVISGSVPRSIAKGYSFESVFPCVAPEMTATPIAGGALAVGSYSLQAVWKWVDDAGIIHRSAPSQTVATATTAGANLTLRCQVQNLQLHNRESGTIYIELYSTKQNPTAADPKVLQAVVAQTAGSALTQIDITAAWNLGNLPLYTNNGAILQNLPVSADGGVTTVNRRMWVSDGKSVYGSKKFKSDATDSVAWNDEGPLTLRLPTPAGRVLALEALDDKLIILCERGIYFTQGDGPEDSGLGSDFLFPVLISQLGVSNEQGSVQTARGVVFHSQNNTPTGLPGYGGVYLITHSLSVVLLSVPAQRELNIGDYELAYVAERDLLVVNSKRLSKVLVLDMRAGENGQWALWNNPNGDVTAGVTPGTCMACSGVNGALWGVYDRNSDATPTMAVGVLNAQPGYDSAFKIGDTTHAVQMTLETNHIYANTNDGLGWARLRGVSVLSRAVNNDPSNPYTQTITVFQDQTSKTPALSNTFTYAGTVTNNPWPTGRDAPEYRVPQQKCSQIKVVLSAIPAIPMWTALRLDVTPSRAKAPAAQRH